MFTQGKIPSSVDDVNSQWSSTMIMNEVVGLTLLSLFDVTNSIIVSCFIPAQN